HDPRTNNIYTLSLHDALPISQEQPGHPERGHRLEVVRLMTEPRRVREDDPRDERGTDGAREPGRQRGGAERGERVRGHEADVVRDRKSTRLNSSHDQISYAVF